MKKYERYKASGVEWIGDIPEHWEVRKLKFMARIKNGLDYKHIETNDTGYPVVGSGGQFSFASNYLFDGESILLGRKGTIDKPKYLNGKYWVVDTSFYTKVFKTTSVKFFYYCCLSLIKFDYYATSTALPSMTQTDLNNNFLFFPPTLEQQKIASFLDDKSQKIEQFIKNKQRLIELLEEEKKALITEAVTKGINPDVSYKNSGVEWVGDIPEHWEVRKLKFCIDLINNKSTQNITQKYIGLENIEGWSGKIIESSNFIEPDGVSKNFKKDNVLFSKLRPYLAKAFIADFSGICTSELLVFQSKLFNEPFLLMLFLTSKFIDLVDSSTYGSKMPRANWDFIGNILVSIPSLKEQQKIVTYIEQKSEKIDVLKTKYQQEIDLINEYKERLIYDAVTGKIKIP